MSELDTDAGASGQYRDPRGAASIGDRTSSYTPVEDHSKCIVFCLNPPRRGRSRRRYCPGCSGLVVVRPLAELADVIEPEWPRWTRLAVFLAAWWAAFLDGLDQFRRREPPYYMPCPLCEHDDWQEVSAYLIERCGQHGQADDTGEGPAR